MRIGRWFGVLALVASCGVAGCGRGKGEATPPAKVGGAGRGASDAATLPPFDVSGDAGEAEGGGASLGASKENPVPTCGASHSYEYIASDVLCADGRSPFAGDLRSASQARVGNVGPNASMHVIDLYEVPCPEGMKQVYIDMYDCENARPSRAEIEVDRLMKGVTGGDFDPFIRRCREASAQPGRLTTMLKACVQVMPAVLDAAGDAQGAQAWLAKWCVEAPSEPEPDGERPRFVYLDNVLASVADLAEARGASPTEAAERRAQRSAAFARSCAIEPAEFERWKRQAGGR